MVSSAPVPLFEADRDGRVARSNPAFAQLVGPSDGPGGRSFDLARLLGDEGWRRLVAAIEAQGTARHLRTELLRADGGAVPVEVSVSSVRLPSEETRLIGSVLDVSHRPPAEDHLAQEAAGDTRAVPPGPISRIPEPTEHV